MIFFRYLLPSCQNFLLFHLVQVATNTTMSRSLADLGLKGPVCNLSQREVETQGLEVQSRPRSLRSSLVSQGGRGPLGLYKIPFSSPPQQHQNR